MKNKRILTIAAILSLFSESQAQSPFTKITTGAIATDQGQFAIPTWADFENRGLLDLFVADYGGANVFYRNNGDGSFTKVTEGNLLQYIPYETSAPVADFDNDGYVDAAIIAGSGAPAPGNDLFYHNNGDGSFASVSGGGVTNIPGYFNVGAWADYDNDGFVDFFVAQADPNNVPRNSVLLHNNGDGTFTPVTNAVTRDTIYSTSAAWADYDNDGFMDLIVSAASHNLLYHNNRDGTFTKITTNLIATDVWADSAWTPTWGDYDNDGLPDLFVAGMQSGNRLYHNEGNGAFTRVATGPMLAAPVGGGSRACGWGDYDNDGFLDLFVTRYPNNGLTSNLLYHNNGNTNNWLEVKLIGTVANRSAIGAKVRIHATIAGKAFWQVHEMTTGGGRWVQPLVAHFGLGNATNVDTLRIEWPSGTMQEISNVAPRQILTITEPPKLLANATNLVPQFFLKAWPQMQFDVQSSTNLTDWSPLEPVTVTNLNGLAEIIASNGPDSGRLFYRAVSR